MAIDEKMAEWLNSSLLFLLLLLLFGMKRCGDPSRDRFLESYMNQRLGKKKKTKTKEEEIAQKYDGLRDLKGGQQLVKGLV